MTAVIAERIASTKQISLIARLIGEREWDQGNPRAVAAAGYLAGSTGISSGEASMTITYLLGCPVELLRERLSDDDRIDLRDLRTYIDQLLEEQP